jgi:predicted Zn-dependent protease
MKPLLFSIILLLIIFSPLTAQGQGEKSGPRNLSGDVSGAISQMDDAISQMEAAFARTDEDLSPEDAYYLGRAVAANILTRYRLYTQKPALIRYLNQICSTITINSPMPEIYNGYHVAILDSPDMNAFATTGGHIFVCRGLLEALASEDAVAAVLAHEIAHIQLRHSIELIDETRLTQDLSNVADRAARLAGLNEQKMRFDNSVREMVTTLFESGYKREQEFAADAYALKLLAGAGYSPSSLVDVLTLLQRTGGTDGFNSTHPSPAQRINNVRGENPQYRLRDTRSFRASRFAGAFR